MVRLTDRQMKLLGMLQSRQRISTEEIKALFGVSAATASRDIHALVMAGAAVKVSQGLKLAPPAEVPFHEKKCFVCGGALHERTIFVVQMQDGSRRNACCCHCGLISLDRAGVQSALASDFIDGKLVDARQATYVLGSNVRLCCEPSTLCFANEEEARYFQKGFGGSLDTMTSAVKQLKISSSTRKEKPYHQSRGILT